MDDLDTLRQQISTAPFNRADLADDPIVQFERWYEEAQLAQLPQPNGMSLATAVASGRVTSRMVIMRQVDERGFVFFTGLNTQKVADINENAQVALLFPWLLLNRQVRIEGTAVALPQRETWQYFLSRSPNSQLGAWFTQSAGVLSSKGVLKAKWAEMKRKFSDGQIPLPSGWGGYRVQPNRVEFWNGRRDGLHDRFEYTRQTDSTWHIQRLHP